VGVNHNTVNWDNPDAYAIPGVEPTARNFFRMRDGSGTYLDARHLKSLHFEADGVYPAPMEWTVDPDGHGAGNPALASGLDINGVTQPGGE
jgi:hypothetical protein